MHSQKLQNGSGSARPGPLPIATSCSSGRGLLWGFRIDLVALGRSRQNSAGPQGLRGSEVMVADGAGAMGGAPLSVAKSIRGATGHSAQRQAALNWTTGL